MVIDWECAPLTKPDKPLLAFANDAEMVSAVGSSGDAVYFKI